jgi:hypothetical protein
VRLSGPGFTRALGAQGERVTRVLAARPQAGPEVAAAFERTFRRPASLHALLGHDAMTTVLRAVGRAGRKGNDRAAVARTLLAAAPAAWGVARVRDGRLGTPGPPR